MAKIRKVETGLVYGKLPKGCKLCGKGAKLVLFLTGKCPFNCFYCPIALERKGKDVMFANERPVEKLEDILEEAKLMGALGAGITGGDPLVSDRIFEVVELLKENFGKKFHIHIYTKITDLPRLERLYALGVDEIRFHFALPPKEVTEWSWSVGGEIPVIPGWEKQTKEFITKAQDLGFEFVNLNELEFSASNWKRLENLGFIPTERYTVKGSEETAKNLLKWAEAEGLSISLHYCSAEVKLRVQLRKRYLRAAKNIAKKFEVITDEGTVIRGEIPYSAELVNLLRRKGFKYEVLGEKIVTSPKAVEVLKKGRIIEYLPTYDRKVVEVISYD